MKKYSVLAWLAVAQFVMVLDGTVMNVSISNVVSDLGTTVNGMQAAITFYTLTMTIFMLIGAKLGGKIGLLKAFAIGCIIYGIGSLLTGLSKNLTMLMLGWSLIEGIGAVLVIPAIIALIATNYQGKDRVFAYAAIGGISGISAAAGPIIGGFVTQFFSWRYVFLVETIIMILVLFGSRKIKSSPKDTTIKIDIQSALLSVGGLGIFVLGLLQSKTWGWVTPIYKPTVFGVEIAPLGISIVAYMLVLGIFLLKMFYDRQLKLEQAGKQPLFKASSLKIPQLRSGLSVLMFQYVIIGSVFFMIPIYLQLVLGMNALQTGFKILPLALALLIFSFIGSRLSNSLSPKQIVFSAQLILVVGTLFFLATISPDLATLGFGTALFFIGAGLGLLTSQLSNINISAVPESQSNEIGGVQGTFQNLGSSLGTALIGTVLISALTTGFVSNLLAGPLPEPIKEYVRTSTVKSVPIVSSEDIKQLALSNPDTAPDAEAIANEYKEAQVYSLKKSSFLLFFIACLSFMLSRNIPKEKPPEMMKVRKQ